jgi:hypothetical protein
MKKIRFAIILLVLTIFCDHGKNFLVPGMPYYGDRNLSIMTEQNIYRWDDVVSNHPLIPPYFFVKCDLANYSDKDYYTRVLKTRPEESDIFRVTNGMQGYFERYDETIDSWEDYDSGLLAQYVIEDITVKSHKKYTLIGGIFGESTGNSTGKFRFRMEYYNQPNPQPPNAIQFVDYSNVFEIR